VSWVDADEFKSLYPSFELADKLILQRGRDVMWGKVYSRREKAGTKNQGVPSAAATATTQD
jgi:hypothetical protein